MRWLIDGVIPLTQICEGERWDMELVVRSLNLLGLELNDSKSFARWAFATVNSRHRNGYDQDDGFLTDDQFERLCVRRSVSKGGG